jgi:hypothetical protein
MQMQTQQIPRPVTEYSQVPSVHLSVAKLICVSYKKY